MADDRQPPIDPRYDPAFQRGGTGASGIEGGSGRLRSAEPGGLVASVSNGSNASVPRASVPAGIDDDPFGQLQAREAAQVDEEPDESDEFSGAGVPSAADGGHVTVQGNPWLLAAWVVGALLFLGGFAAAYLSQSAKISVDPTDFVTPMVLELLAPPLVLAGLLSLLGAVFVHVLAWRGRARARAGSSAGYDDAD